jgi:hypothetical protein
VLALAEELSLPEFSLDGMLAIVASWANSLV